MSTKKRNIAHIVGQEEWLNEECRMEYKRTGAETAMEDSEAHDEKAMMICGMHMSLTSKRSEN
jgi:hypothetical protein